MGQGVVKECSPVPNWMNIIHCDRGGQESQTILLNYFLCASSGNGCPSIGDDLHFMLLRLYLCVHSDWGHIPVCFTVSCSLSYRSSRTISQLDQRGDWKEEGRTPALESVVHNSDSLKVTQLSGLL